MRALKIEPGHRSGKLVCLAELPRRDGMRLWNLRCDCGEIVTLLQKSFCSGGRRTSCGCDRTSGNPHGLSKRPEYRHWINMISRCENPNTPGFEHYGGRGIRVCDQWRASFEVFFADVGPKPSPGHSVDRIEVNGNYEPGNCRWALPKTQCRNTRSNRIVIVDGRKLTLAEAVEKSPVPYNTVLYRLKRGWQIDDALRLPAKKGYRPHA